MKRIIGITTAALMGASVMAAPAIAQTALDDTPPAGATTTMPETAPGADATTTMPDLDTDTTASIGADFTTALTAIEGNSSSAAAIGTLEQVDRVNVVPVNTLEGHDSMAFEDALTTNDAGVTELQSSIQGNAALSEELATQGVQTDDVVAAQVEADGEVTLYVR